MPRTFWSRLFNRRRARPAGLRASTPFRPRLEGLEDRTLLSVGDLDPTFGNAGKVLVSFQDSLHDVPTAVVRQPDGKLVVGGTSSVSNGLPAPATVVHSEFALARYNADGSLDATFGTGGKLTLDVPDAHLRLAVQPDGKLVLFGKSTAAATGDDFFLARLTATGAFDVTFGSGGRVTTDFGGNESAGQVLIQPDGKLVVAGTSSLPGQASSSPTFTAILARYNADGSLDQTFGSAGRVLEPGESEPQPVVLPDGKLLVALLDSGKPALRRFNADGTPDASFGSQGEVLSTGTFSPDTIYAAALQSDGKLLVAGTRLILPEPYNPAPPSNPLVLARFNPDGSVDTGFGSGGQTGSSFRFVTPTGLAVQGDGGIVVTLSSSDNPRSGVLLRYLPNGVLDSNFGLGGVVTFAHFVDTSGGLTLDGTGVAVAGTVSGPRSSDFGLARVNADGSLDQGFGTGGEVTTDFVGPVNSTAGAAVRQPDGKVVLVGTARSGAASSVGVARFNPDGTPDATFSSDGQVLLNAPSQPFGGPFDTGRAVAVQPDGKIVVMDVYGQFSSFSTTLFQLNADGSLDNSFGPGGSVTLPDFMFNPVPGDLLVQPDGRILVGRTSLDAGQAITRLNADGSVDRTFAAGVVGEARALALQADGRILVGGLTAYLSGDTVVGRFTTDGQPDPAFGRNGQAVTPRPLAAGGQQAVITDLTVQPDDRIVAVGITEPYHLQERNGGVYLVRFLADGAPDPSFGSNGIVQTYLGAFTPPTGQNQNDLSASVVVLPDGSLVVAANSTANGGDFALLVYRPDGRLDERFGNQGIITTAFASGADTVRNLFRQADGKLLVAGTATVGGLQEFALARYEGDTLTGPLLDDDARFVQDLYQDLLGRTPSAAERDAREAVLEGPRFQALNATALNFVRSDEGRGRVIAGYYQDFLGRSASAAEVAGWVDAERHGATPEHVLALLLGSPEYLQRAGGTNAAWLDQVYRDLLGRDRDAGAQPFLVGLEQGGLTRVQMATILLSSGEYRERFLGQVYQRFLGRQPGSGETSFWVELLGQLGGGEPVVAGVAASGEAFSRVGGSNRAWLENLYQQVLGRPFDVAGYQGHLSGIEAAYAAARQGLAAAFTASDEFHRHTVAGYYTRFLGREAAAGELDFWAAALRGGATLDQVLAKVLGSDEYFGRAQRDNQTWLTQLYGELLSRGLDNGAQGFVDALNQNRTTREQVVLVVLSSPEYRRLLARRVYSTYLGRLIGDAESAAVSALLAGGVRQEAVVAAVLAFNERFEMSGQRASSGPVYP
jgi:uncharacterized delta-60 repeat protein